MKIRWTMVTGCVIIYIVLLGAFLGLAWEEGIISTLISLSIVGLMLGVFYLGLYLVGKDIEWKWMDEEDS